MSEPTVAVTPRRIVRPDDVEARVSPLELFFDLVFVFALTQVTAFMAEDPSFAGMGRGLMILAILWWAWSGYAWLTSTVDPELGAPRIVIFLAMGALLVVALATPGAFGDDGVLWGLAYFAVRILHVALSGRAEPAKGSCQPCPMCTRARSRARGWGEWSSRSPASSCRRSGLLHMTT